MDKNFTIKLLAIQDADLCYTPLRDRADAGVGIACASLDVTDTKGRKRTDAFANGTLLSNNNGDNS
jgi:hypothetical protein